MNARGGWKRLTTTPRGTPAGRRSRQKHGLLSTSLVAWLVCLVFLPAAASLQPGVAMAVSKSTETSASGASPRPAAEIAVAPEAPRTVDTAMASYLRAGFTEFGGFPDQGSAIESTASALSLIHALNQTTPLYDPTTIYTLLANRFTSAGGFQELHASKPTVANTYDVLRCLELLGMNYGATVNASIATFLNGLVVNETFFLNQEGDVTTTPETLAQAVTMLEWLNQSVTIDYNDTLTYLFDQFFTASRFDGTAEDVGLFSVGDDTEYRSTYHALLLLTILDALDQTRTLRHDYSPTLVTGELLAGTAPALHERDGLLYQLNSSAITGGHAMNITFEASAEELLDVDGTDSLAFEVTLNLSNALDSNGSLWLYNVQADAWENLTTTQWLTGASAPQYTHLRAQTAEIDLAKYLTESSAEYGRAFQVALFLNHSSNFTADVDEFQYEYTTFNKTFTAEQVADGFSGSFFSAGSTKENYYAVKCLELLDVTTDPTYLNFTDYDRLYNYTLSLQDAAGYYRLGGGAANPSMAGNYFATYLLGWNHSLPTTHLTNMTRFVQGWQFPDGGFGSYAQCSLFATYRVTKLLSDANALDLATETKIATYLNACHPTNAIYYDDGNSEVSTFGDTFYAYHTSLLISLPVGANLTAIVDNLLTLQTATGNFADQQDVKNLYYVVALLHLGGAQNRLTYPAQFKQYLVNLQTQYGGCLKNAFETIPTVEATAYVLRMATLFDFIDEFRVFEEDQFPGLVDFLEAHQDDLGGFYEDTFLENGTYVPTNALTRPVVEAIAPVYYAQYMNGTSLADWVYGQMNTLNDVTALQGALKYTFYDVLEERYHVYATYLALQQAQLHVRAVVDDDVTYPNNAIPMTLHVSLPWNNSYLVEGCELYVSQRVGNNATSFSLDDHLNGSYSCTLMAYPQSGYYPLRVICSHPNFMNFRQNLTLVINDPIDLGQLYDVESQWVWFRDSHSIGVPVTNLTSNNFTRGLNLTLQDATGRTLCQLTENTNTSLYETCNLNFSTWWYTNEHFTLHVEGPLIRNEVLDVHVLVFPWGFILLVVAVVAAVVTAVVVGRKKVKKSRMLKRYAARKEDLTELERAKAEILLEKRRIKSEKKAVKKRGKAEKAAQKAALAVTSAEVTVKEAKDNLRKLEVITTKLEKKADEAVKAAKAAREKAKTAREKADADAKKAAAAKPAPAKAEDEKTEGVKAEEGKGVETPAAEPATPKELPEEIEATKLEKEAKTAQAALQEMKLQVQKAKGQVENAVKDLEDAKKDAEQKQADLTRLEQEATEAEEPSKAKKRSTPAAKKSTAKKSAAKKSTSKKSTSKKKKNPSKGGKTK